MSECASPFMLYHLFAYTIQCIARMSIYYIASRRMAISIWTLSGPALRRLIVRVLLVNGWWSFPLFCFSFWCHWVDGICLSWSSFPFDWGILDVLLLARRIFDQPVLRKDFVRGWFVTMAALKSPDAAFEWRWLVHAFASYEQNDNPEGMTWLLFRVHCS